MKDRPLRESDSQSTDTAAETSLWPDCRWNLQEPRSCLEPDSCGCYVDPCVYSGVASEDCCIDADILCGA